jgi:hypothetical protein
MIKLENLQNRLALKMVTKIVMATHTRNGNSYSYELEKFAELIVRECLSLSSDLYPFDAMDAAGVGAKSQYGSAALLRVYENTNDQYYDAIKKHFGVEK